MAGRSELVRWLLNPRTARSLGSRALRSTGSLLRGTGSAPEPELAGLLRNVTYKPSGVRFESRPLSELQRGIDPGLRQAATLPKDRLSLLGTQRDSDWFRAYMAAKYPSDDLSEVAHRLVRLPSGEMIRVPRDAAAPLQAPTGATTNALRSLMGRFHLPDKRDLGWGVFAAGSSLGSEEVPTWKRLLQGQLPTTAELLQAYKDPWRYLRALGWGAATTLGRTPFRSRRPFSAKNPKGYPHDAGTWPARGRGIVTGAGSVGPWLVNADLPRLGKGWLYPENPPDWHTNPPATTFEPQELQGGLFDEPLPQTGIPLPGLEIRPGRDTTQAPGESQESMGRQDVGQPATSPALEALEAEYLVRLQDALGPGFLLDPRVQQLRYRNGRLVPRWWEQDLKGFPMDEVWDKIRKALAPLPQKKGFDKAAIGGPTDDLPPRLPASTPGLPHREEGLVRNALRHYQGRGGRAPRGLTPSAAPRLPVRRLRLPGRLGGLLGVLGSLGLGTLFGSGPLRRYAGGTTLNEELNAQGLEFGSDLKPRLVVNRSLLDRTQRSGYGQQQLRQWLARQPAAIRRSSTLSPF